MSNEYIIVGDTQNYEGCLVCVCGSDRNHAGKVLKRMTESPTENDIRTIGECVNLRIKEVESKNCWWNDPFLAN